MKTSAILVAAAAFGSAQAGFNATVTDIGTSTVTVPCSTSSIPYLGSAPLGTGTVTFTPPSNGSHTYTRPTLSPTTSPSGTTGTTTGPSAVVTAGASSLDARVFVGAFAAVAAIAFSL